MRPLLVVPGLFSTELYDERLGCLWGTFSRLYGGPPIATLEGVPGAPRRVMRGIPVIPGYAYDLLGALERALQGAGYRTDETLHFFAYDWRQRVLDLGAQLAEEVRGLAERTGSSIDVLGLSNGGLVIRGAYARDRELPIERVITSGAPHGGSFETIACLDRGYQFAPLGRTVTPEQFMSCPGAIEAMPAPNVTAFLPQDAGYDLYDVDTWRRLRLAVFRRHPDDPVWTEVVRRRLADFRATWSTLAAGAIPRRLICICGVGLPTQIRVVVRDGRAHLPGEGRLGGLPSEAVGDGDGALTVKAASDWTGVEPEIIPIRVTRHRDTVRTPVAFKAILQALG